MDWTAPGVEQVAAGVHRIPLPLPNDGLRAVNVYALTGPDGLVLIDSGWALAQARAQLETALATLGAGLGDVTRFLVTHVHRDHYTLGLAIRRELGTPVLLGRGEQASLELLCRPGHLGLESQLRLLRRCGATELAQRLTKWREAARDGGADEGPDVWEMPDDWLADGQLLAVGERRLEVVETPGHTVGHVVFHDLDGGLLFAGDHVLPRITPSIGLEPVTTVNPLRAFLASLAAVRRRPDALLLPAHGPVAASVHARVDELVEHHDTRLRRIEAAVTGGETAFEVAGRLRWTRREHALADLDDFNQMLAVGETAAHLDLLVAQQRLLASGEEPRRYAPG